MGSSKDDFPTKISANKETKQSRSPSPLTPMINSTNPDPLNMLTGVYQEMEPREGRSDENNGNSRSNSNVSTKISHYLDDNNTIHNGNSIRHHNHHYHHHQRQQEYLKDDSNNKQNKRKQLLVNPIYPTTVPPFVFDEMYHNMDNQSTEQGNVNSRDKNALESDMKWVKLVENVGSNINYFPSQRVTVFDHDGHKQKMLGFNDNYSIMNGRRSIASSIFSVDTLDDDEKARIRNEILCDLESQWEGDNRLNQLLYFKNENFSFKDQQEEEQWNEYLPRLFRKVYKGSEDNENEKSPQPVHIKGSRKNKRNQFETETERWRIYFEKKVNKWRPKWSNILDNSRYLPLAFRILVMIFSLIALGLAVRIYQNSNSYKTAEISSIPQQASTIMAICVNSIACVYVIYIAIDEFRAAPIGLRNLLDKMKVVLLDILFIIFSSANLALAFNTRYDREWVCSSYYLDNTISQATHVSPSVPYICRKQKALSSFLFILLFAWVINVIFSMLRIVRRTVTR